ncbi:MAG: Asp23/Gls24 family envelope stress response protein [Eubacterium sp.]|nr:Asp23/Gls24 family envelope stress response protein [Eubacterium sp.]
MKGKMNTEMGQILIDPDVIAQYAGETAYECFGIVGMSMVSMRDGIARLLKRDSLAKGIEVEINENNEITIDFHIIVAYGNNIITIAENIIESVKYKVEEFTGMTVAKVNVIVEGVRVID